MKMWNYFMNHSHLLSNPFWVMTFKRSVLDTLNCLLFSLFSLNWSGRMEKTVMKKPMVITRGENETNLLVLERQPVAKASLLLPKGLSVSSCSQQLHKPSVQSFIHWGVSTQMLCFISLHNRVGAGWPNQPQVIVSRPKFLGKMCSSADSHSFSSPLLIYQKPWWFCCL